MIFWPGTDTPVSQDNYFTLRPTELPPAAPGPVLGRPATGRRGRTSEDIKRDTAKRKLRRAADRQAKGIRRGKV